LGRRIAARAWNGWNSPPRRAGEHYSDFGSTVNPKVGLLWSPVDDLNLRATFGRSFRAPGLRELHDAAANGPTNLNFGGARVLTLFLSGGNPDLRPETADSWTVGADWGPSQFPGLRVSFSWFDVRYRNRIDAPVANVLGTALTDPTVATFVRRLDPNNAADLAAITALLASPATSTAQGSFPATSYGAIVDGRYVNTGALEVEGVDLTATYVFQAAGGQLTLGANASDLLRYDQAVTPTSPVPLTPGDGGFPCAPARPADGRLDPAMRSP
jgi:outer membrane receptor protein involved in Fe transport